MAETVWQFEQRHLFGDAEALRLDVEADGSLLLYVRGAGGRLTAIALPHEAATGLLSQLESWAAGRG